VHLTCAFRVTEAPGAIVIANAKTWRLLVPHRCRIGTVYRMDPEDKSHQSHEMCAVSPG
jgi:hypothetical protein